MSDRRYYLVGYDVRNHRRLARVARFMEGEGIRMQYSVFLVPASEAGVRRLIEGLAQRIEPSQDDVRIYPLPPRPDVLTIGAQLWVGAARLLTPEGLTLSGHIDLEESQS